MAIGKNLAGSFGNGGFLVNDNPNVWNARNQAAISSEKAYGNPALNPSVATQLADQANKGDPWYALGRMIGAGYMQNYNERGIDKKANAADAAIRNAFGVGTPPPDASQQSGDTSLGGLPVQYNDNIPASWDARDQMKKEKRDFFVDKYSNSPNPTSDSIAQANAEKQKQALADRINNFRKLDPVMMYNIGDAEIEKMGGTQYQKDMARARLREKIGGYMASVNKEIFDYDSKEVEGLINSGDYEKAWTKYQDLAARDKDRADAMFKGIPTIPQIWANQNKQAEIAARRAYGGGYYGKQQQPSTYAKQMFDQYGGLYKSLIGKKDLSPHEMALKENLTSIFSQDPVIVGMLQNQMRKNSWDIVSDYNKTGEYIRQMKAKGMSDADIGKNLNIMAGLSPDNNDPNETVHQHAASHGLLLGGGQTQTQQNKGPNIIPNSANGYSDIGDIKYISNDDFNETLEDYADYNRGKASKDELLNSIYNNNPNRGSF